MKRTIFVSVLISVLMPVAAYASTIDDLRAQVQVLLQQLDVLQQQTSGTTSTTNTTTTNTSTPWWCSTYQDLSYGSYGQSVSALQQAMGSDLGVAPTGYYGPLTRNIWHRRCWVNPNPEPTPIPPIACSQLAILCPMGYHAVYNTTGSCSSTCVPDTSTQSTVTISSFSGPTTLGTGQQGTWSIQASDSANGTLSYSVTWGDEHYAPTFLNGAYATQQLVSQNSTFTHIYGSSGTYTVTITVRDQYGATSQTSTTVVVTDNTNPISGALSVSPTSGSSPLTVTFTSPWGVGVNQSGVPLVGVTVNIDFGDGSQQALNCPASAQINGTTCSVPLTIPHTYTQPGTYTATVYSAPVVPFPTRSALGSVIVTVNGSTNQSLTASPTSGAAPLTVTFNGVGASINFGDGTGSSSYDSVVRTILHTYTSPGTYTAISNGSSVLITVSGTTSNCPRTGDFYDSQYAGCICPTGYTKQLVYQSGQYGMPDQSLGPVVPTMFYCADPIHPVLYKPVIYLYPQSTTSVSVGLHYDGNFLVTYPEYRSGWNVIAHPDGSLVDQADGKPYSYLFWEGQPSAPVNYDLTTGFVVKKADLVPFLQTKLSALGLTPKEYNEFIVYWYPKLMNDPYTIIHFATPSEYDVHAPLTISPKPDSVLRVFMVAKSVDDASHLSVAPQTIKPFTRTGFTVVEWGGTQVQ